MHQPGARPAREGCASQTPRCPAPTSEHAEATKYALVALQTIWDTAGQERFRTLTSCEEGVYVGWRLAGLVLGALGMRTQAAVSGAPAAMTP